MTWTVCKHGTLVNSGNHCPVCRWETANPKRKPKSVVDKVKEVITGGPDDETAA